MLTRCLIFSRPIMHSHVSVPPCLFHIVDFFPPTGLCLDSSYLFLQVQVKRYIPCEAYQSPRQCLFLLLLCSISALPRLSFMLVILGIFSSKLWGPQWQGPSLTCLWILGPTKDQALSLPNRWLLDWWNFFYVTTSPKVQLFPQIPSLTLSLSLHFSHW